MEKVKLSDVADITKLAGFEFTKYIKYIDDGEIIAVRALNLKDGELVLDDVKRISKTVSDSLERSRLRKYDIVISYTGTIGECAQIVEDGKYHLAPNVAKITPKSNVDPNYLFQYIRSSMFENIMRSYCHGSTQPTIPMKVIRELPVYILSKESQRKVAVILQTLDAKIQNNKLINQNLEQQAQALYWQLFVNNANSTWQQGHLSDLVTVKYGKDHKKLADGLYPLYGSGGIMRYVERSLYDEESVLIPRKGSLNNIIYVNEPFWSVDTMFYTVMRRPNVAKYVYHFVKSINLASLNAGSAVPSMTTDILNALEITIPSNETLLNFENIVAPMYDSIKENDLESSKLANIRDTLLPKLMSGELDVSTINI